MKQIFVLLLITTAAISSYCQEYTAENEIFLTLSQNKKIYNWVSGHLTTSVNLVTAEMTLQVDAFTFRSQNDSLAGLNLFSPNCTSIMLLLGLPFNKLDENLSGKQIHQLNGTLAACNNRYPVNVSIGFQYLDEILMFEFTTKLDAALIGATGLKRADRLAALSVINGKVLQRAKD